MSDAMLEYSALFSCFFTTDESNATSLQNLDAGISFLGQAATIGTAESTPVQDAATPDQIVARITKGHNPRKGSKPFRGGWRSWVLPTADRRALMEVVKSVVSCDPSLNCFETSPYMLGKQIFQTVEGAEIFAELERTRDAHNITTALKIGRTDNIELRRGLHVAICLREIFAEVSTAQPETKLKNFVEMTGPVLVFTQIFLKSIGHPKSWPTSLEDILQQNGANNLLHGESNSSKKATVKTDFYVIHGARYRFMNLVGNPQGPHGKPHWADVGMGTGTSTLNRWEKLKNRYLTTTCVPEALDKQGWISFNVLECVLGLHS